MQVEVVDVLMRVLSGWKSWAVLYSVEAYYCKECSLDHPLILFIGPNRYQQWILRQIFGQIRS